MIAERQRCSAAAATAINLAQAQKDHENQRLAEEKQMLSAQDGLKAVLQDQNAAQAQLKLQEAALAAAASQVQAAEERAANAAEENKTANLQLAMHQSTTSALTAKREECENQLAALRKSVSVETTAMTATQASIEQQLSATNTKLRTQQAGISSLLSDRTQLLQELSAAKADLEGAQTQLEERTKRMAAAAATEAEVRDKIQQAKMQLKALQCQHAERVQLEQCNNKQAAAAATAALQQLYTVSGSTQDTVSGLVKNTASVAAELEAPAASDLNMLIGKLNEVAALAAAATDAKHNKQEKGDAPSTRATKRASIYTGDNLSQDGFTAQAAQLTAATAAAAACSSMVAHICAASDKFAASLKAPTSNHWLSAQEDTLAALALLQSCAGDQVIASAATTGDEREVKIAASAEEYYSDEAKLQWLLVHAQRVVRAIGVTLEEACQGAAVDRKLQQQLDSCKTMLATSSTKAANWQDCTVILSSMSAIVEHMCKAVTQQKEHRVRKKQEIEQPIATFLAELQRAEHGGVEALLNKAEKFVEQHRYVAIAGGYTPATLPPLHS